jgi:hypothetical protein
MRSIGRPEWGRACSARRPGCPSSEPAPREASPAWRAADMTRSTTGSPTGPHLELFNLVRTLLTTMPLASPINPQAARHRVPDAARAQINRVPEAGEPPCIAIAGLRLR